MSLKGSVPFTGQDSSQRLLHQIQRTSSLVADIDRPRAPWRSGSRPSSSQPQKLRPCVVRAISNAISDELDRELQLSSGIGDGTRSEPRAAADYMPGDLLGGRCRLLWEAEALVLLTE